jgi:ATP-dependent Lhr-like helicase
VLHTLMALPLGRGGRGAPSTGSEQALARRAEQSSAAWQPLFDRLKVQNRVFRAQVDGRGYWIAAERAQSFRQIFPDTTFETAVPDFGKPQSKDDALLALVTGWMGHIGPTSSPELGTLLGVEATEIEKAMLRLEATGAILRGKFTEAATRAGVPVPHEHEWCDRRLLARIHRLTVATLRKQIEPVTPAQFMRWLLRWQHVTPDSQARGERATLEVLRQLQGFEIPANAWERHVLARRIADYDPSWLNQLCLTGAVGWGRLSPHPATLEASDGNNSRRRVIPTSVAPITFFVREDADWMLPQERTDEGQGLSPVAKQVLEFLRHRGASFFADIVRATGKLKAEVETGLWDGRSRAGDGGWIRQSACPDRSEASLRAGKWPHCQASAQRGPLGDPAHRFCDRTRPGC